MWIIFSSCTEEKEENKKQSVHPLQVSFLGEQEIPYGKHSSHLKSRLLEAGQVLNEMITKDRSLQSTLKEVSLNKDGNRGWSSFIKHKWTRAS